VRLRRVFVGVLVAAALLTGCAGEQRAASLAVGDCFDDTEAMFTEEEIFRVPSVPCTQPHDNEVFHVAQYPGSAYARDDIEEFADRVCYSAFGPYVGRSYETSIVDYSWFMPTPDSWSLGDREITCIAFHMDFEKLRGSVRGSGL
jgi:hypothetical protein